MIKFKVNKPLRFTDNDTVVHEWKVGDFIELGELYRPHWYLVDLINSGGITEIKEPEPNGEIPIEIESKKRGRPRGNR